jgi:hypothetical protein
MVIKPPPTSLCFTRKLTRTPRLVTAPIHVLQGGAPPFGFQGLRRCGENLRPSATYASRSSTTPPGPLHMLQGGCQLGFRDSAVAVKPGVSVSDPVFSFQACGIRW